MCEPQESIMRHLTQSVTKSLLDNGTYAGITFCSSILRHDSIWCCGHSQYLRPEYNEMGSASEIKLCQEVLVSVALCMRCHSAQSLSPCYLCVLAAACWGIMVQASHSLYISLTKKTLFPTGGSTLNKTVT